VPIRGAFLDYGCGLGRALFVAAQESFTRVIGVELAETLVAKAKANAQRAGARLRCPIVIETANASTYQRPDDVGVIHYNNPFRGEVLRKTVQQIRHSLDRAPRELWIAFAGAGSFEKLLPLPWVEFVEARRFYQTWGYRIYRCSP
jgi:tRNA1(Val) A37 N6-methylase TrmN6